jgi:hypothetical protein
LTGLKTDWSRRREEKAVFFPKMYGTQKIDVSHAPNAIVFILPGERRRDESLLTRKISGNWASVSTFSHLSLHVPHFALFLLRVWLEAMSNMTIFASCSERKCPSVTCTEMEKFLSLEFPAFEKGSSGRVSNRSNTFDYPPDSRFPKLTVLASSLPAYLVPEIVSILLLT